MANIMRNRGVAKGDRVTIYMPMIPEAAYAMLACARHRRDPFGGVRRLLAGFAGKPHPDAKSAFIITADEGLRGGRKVPLKVNVDAAIERVGRASSITCWSCAAPATPVNMVPGRDVYYDEAAQMVTDECPVEEMNAEDPLFILYTSGSTGTAEGRAAHHRRLSRLCGETHQYVFDYHDGDIYWCTADVGWVTGHSYILYGPLANGATTLMFEGVPTYPSISRFWEVIDKHKRQHLLHRPDRDPLAHAGGRGAGEEDLAQVPAPARLASASRSIRKPGNGTIASSATIAARSSTPGGRPRPAAS